MSPSHSLTYFDLQRTDLDMKQILCVPVAQTFSPDIQAACCAYEQTTTDRERIRTRWRRRRWRCRRAGRTQCHSAARPRCPETTRRSDGRRPVVRRTCCDTRYKTRHRPSGTYCAVAAVGGGAAAAAAGVAAAAVGAGGGLEVAVANCFSFSPNYICVKQ